MPYHQTTKAAVKNAPRSLGATLGRLAIKNRLSVLRVSEITGASRVTIYTWFAGGSVTNAYRATVNELIKTLRQKQG